MLLLLCSLASPLAANPLVLGGRVLSAKTGQPLKRARIELSKAQDHDPPRRTESDRDGSFLFRGLEPGDYRVSAECQGYAKYPGRGVPVTVKAGKQPAPIVLQLAPHAVISGRIVDEDGEPLAGAHVVAARKPGRTAADGGHAFSNDLGQYRIWGLAAGRYYVQASLDRPSNVIMPRREGASDKPEAAYPVTFYPGVTDPAAAAPVELTAGTEAQGIDLRLVKARVFYLRGRFVNQGKSGVGAVMLWLRNGGPPGVQQPTTAVCDQEGAFEFPGLRPGGYTLQALGGPGARIAASLNVDITAEDVNGVVLSAVPGIEIGGAARLEGEPDLKWREASVSIGTPDSDFGPAATAEIRLDGTFTLKDVPPGRRFLTAHAPGGLYLKSARFGKEEVLDTAFDIPATDAPSLTLLFMRADAEVSGVVFNATGEPLAGAAVYWLDLKRRPSDSLFPATVCDAQGRYTLKQVPPGDQFLLALEQEETLEPDQARALQRRATAVRVTAGAHVTADLKLAAAPEDTP